jgi:flagellar motility protein MotE (MotC chaperone)
MKSILKSPWLAGAVGAVLFALTCYLFVSKPAKSKVEALPVTKTAAAWDFRNPELDLIMAELKAQKESLANRENQLKELAVRLQTERQEINQLTQSVYQVQVQFDQNVARVKTEEVANLKKLAKVYSAMTPEGAVAIFKELDDTSIVKIAKFMKEPETAPILEMLAKQGDAEAKRAAGISERIRNSLSAQPLATTP